VSVASGILTSALIGLVVRSRTGSVELGLATGALYLGFPGVAFWIHGYRVDSLAAFFAVAAYVAPDLPRWGVASSVVLVVCGSVVKQTIALAAVPVAVYLLLTRRGRDAGLFVLGVIVLGSAIWGGLNYWSSGYYFDVGVLGNRRAYYPGQAIRIGTTFLTNPVTLAAVYSLVCAWVAEPRAILNSRYVVAGVFALAFAGILSGSEGASSNYYLDSAALVSMLLAIHGLDGLWRTDRGRTGVLLWLAGFGAALSVCGYTYLAAQSRERAPDLASLPGKLATSYVLADRQFIAPVMRVGLVPAVNDPYFYQVAVRNRAVDVHRLVADMRAGRVSAIILEKPIGENGQGEPNWPVQVVDVMRSHYVPSGRADAGFLYLYRQGDKLGGP
jgi:hypothetical protein